MLQGLQKAETRPLILLDCLLVAWYFTVQKPCWHTLECGCTHMCVCLHAYIWKLELHLSCYPPMSTIFLFFLSRVLELTNLARQAGWPPSGIRLLLPSQDGNYKCVSARLAFWHEFAGWKWGPHICKQVIQRLRHFSIHQRKYCYKI